MDSEPQSSVAQESAKEPAPSVKPEMAATTPNEPKSLSVALRIGIVVVIGLIVLAMQAFLNSLSIQRAREDERVMGVRAVAAALRPILLGSEKDRAKMMLGQIVEAGDYASAAIVKDGYVWVATGAPQLNEKVDSKFLNAKGETSAGGTPAGFQVTTGIMAGPENPAGYLQVTFKP